MKIKMKDNSDFIPARETIIRETYECGEGNIWLRCVPESGSMSYPYFANLKTGQCKTFHGQEILRIFNCQFVEI